MSREQTFKTPLRVIKRWYYGTGWLLFSPIFFYIFWPVPVGAMNGPYVQTSGHYYFTIFWIWLWCWLAMHGITWIMCIFMYFWGGLLNNSPSYQQWLAAGGHPFWDSLYFFNNDPPQVRAAIGVPPQQPICYNCGASLTGLFGLGSNYGNVCPNCGACNDTFPG